MYNILDIKVLKMSMLNILDICIYEKVAVTLQHKQ